MCYHYSTEIQEIPLNLYGDSMAIKRGKETFSGYNKPKRTPKHKTKSHAVLAKVGDKVKLIRFGQQGKKVGTLKGTAGKPKKGESARMKAKRKSFKARHAKNIKRGKLSAAWWADRVKWIILFTII